MPRGLDLEKAKARIAVLRDDLLNRIYLLKGRVQSWENLGVLEEMREQVIDLAACLTSVAEETAELKPLPNLMDKLDPANILNLRDLEI